jgi:hypothetical protein
VLLYGSLARGDYAPGSDADLIVVVADSPYPPTERSGHLPPLRLPICYEILVYTEAELSRLQREGSLFLRRALEEGRWLASRAPLDEEAPGSAPADDSTPPEEWEDDDPLILWMLSLTPTQRLARAQGFVNSVRVLRNGRRS